MSPLQTEIVTDTWIAAPWNQYVQLFEDPQYNKTKGYYFRDHMRLEMLPIGFDHGTDHGLIALIINLFAIAKSIPLTLADNVSYRRTGLQECQPDVSCYIGSNAQAVPKDTNIVNLDRYSVPDLVIEIAKTTLLDDLGIKRTLYEELGVAEYWVVDVKNTQVIAYQIHDRGSERLTRSKVLPGLAIATLEEALQRSRESDQATVGAWLLNQFQQT
ncbi:MAG: Uma2 family endonuclease [Leptolyngbyaceae cyanobacterium SL_7_1]|nr:Uma2 family endonuclease [Leptolyngbyaceae cyanobacterium SL_7_1]